MRYYHIAFLAFLCLAIESTSDSSYVSGKGMGYFMILGLCLNANRNLKAHQEKLKRIRLAYERHTTLSVNVENNDSCVADNPVKS